MPFDLQFVKVAQSGRGAGSPLDTLEHQFITIKMEEILYEQFCAVQQRLSRQLHYTNVLRPMAKNAAIWSRGIDDQMGQSFRLLHWYCETSQRIAVTNFVVREYIDSLQTLDRVARFADKIDNICTNFDLICHRYMWLQKIVAERKESADADTDSGGTERIVPCRAM